MKNIIVITIITIITIFIISRLLIHYSNSKKKNLKSNYYHLNNWSKIKNKKKFKNNVNSIDGIEVRILPEDHLLSGEKGVFATKEFTKYDIIGEYTGDINYFDKMDNSNLYIFNLIDNIIIDGEKNSNELKFVNSYLNIAKTPNLCARLCNIGKYPKIVYICNKNIKIGDELLIDYGEEYSNEHILK